MKCEKISHLVEYHLELALGRTTVKDAAGPDDYPHLQRVEHRAKMTGYFNIRSCYIKNWGKGHTYVSGRNINTAISKLEQKLTGKQLADMDKLIQRFLKFDLERAEIVATLYAGWNNLLIDGMQPTDEEIVYESRENWSERKLKLERERFFSALEWMKRDDIGLIPTGKGLRVNKPVSKKKVDKK